MNKINNVAIVIFGVLAIIAIPICMWGSSVFNAEFVRWKEAIIVETADTLNSLNTMDDVILPALLPQDMERSREGFSLYEEWTLKLPVGESRKKWFLTDSFKPAFEITMDGEPITIRGTGARLYYTQYVMVGYDLRFEGIEPGSQITIFGQVSSVEDHLAVKADIICAADKNDCMKEFSQPSQMLIITAVVLAVSGLGLIWYGIKKIRS